MEHEHIQQTGSKISGLSDKMALLNYEAIISPQVFDWVQEEIKRRREGRSRYSGVSILSAADRILAMEDFDIVREDGAVTVTPKAV